MFQGPQSGKFGVIHNEAAPITHMFNWVLDSINHSPETYYASNTLWGPNRNPGVIDWSGNFSLFDGDYIIWAGEFLKCLEFFTAPTTGVYGNPGTTYCGQGIVESVALTWAWGAEQSLTQVVNVAANGCIASRDRVIDDTVVETPAKMCGLQLHMAIDDPPTAWGIIDNVQQAVLTMSAANQPFVNSSTGCCTHRRPGNLDWTLALTMTDHRAVLISRENVPSFRLYNTTTTFWELVYSIFMSKTGITADRQTGAIQSQVVNYQMKAISDTTMGEIIAPDTTTLWPPVATLLSTPDAPTAVAGTPTGNDVSVGWTPPAGGEAPTSYTIWASQDGVDFACVGCSASSPYVDVGVPATTELFYKVAGANAQGQGPFSVMSADAGPIT